MMRSKFAGLSLLAFGALAGSVTVAAAQSVSPGDPQSPIYKPYRLSNSHADRPLTVRRRPAPAPEVVEIAPPLSPVAGPGGIVAEPFHVAGALVALPFEVLGEIFPARGDLATSPQVLIGAPIQAAGEIARTPFRLIDAAFGAPYPGERMQ